MIDDIFRHRESRQRSEHSAPSLLFSKVFLVPSSALRWGKSAFSIGSLRADRAYGWTGPAGDEALWLVRTTVVRSRQMENRASRVKRSAWVDSAPHGESPSLAECLETPPQLQCYKDQECLDFTSGCLCPAHSLINSCRSCITLKMAEVFTQTAPPAGDDASKKGVLRLLRENPYILGLSAVSSPKRT